MSQYMHRDVEDTVFIDWLNVLDMSSSINPALFVNGARQVGKTTTIRHFANKHFKNVYYFNLMTDKKSVDVLKNSGYGSDYNSVYNLMQILTNNQFIDDSYTVIIFDEIQSVPLVYRCLRLFTRELKSQVIITGSYLGFIAEEANAVPVGDTYSVYMTGLTFKEFLQVMEYDYYIDIIKSNLLNLTPFTYDVHNELLKLFNIYMIIGGYPRVVLSYLKDFNDEQMSVTIAGIVDRFVTESIKYLKDIDDKAVLSDVLYYIPRIILKRENITTKVSKVTELANKLDKNHNKIDTKIVKNVITWLRDAHMFTQTGRSLSFEFDDMVGEGRIYLRDTGLAWRILGDTDTAKGIITEGFICTTLEDIFSKNHHDSPKTIAFIESPGLEIDFFVHSIYGKTAIEVKSGSNMKNKGSIRLLDEKKIDFIIRTGESNLGKEGNILTVPLYAFPFLELKKSPIKIPRINKPNAFNINSMNFFK